jgi:hypothetical protein
MCLTFSVTFAKGQIRLIEVLVPDVDSDYDEHKLNNIHLHSFILTLHFFLFFD